MSLINIKNTTEYNSSINSDKFTVALFSAEWAEQCQQILSVMNELSTEQKDLQFLNIPAEDFAEISFKHQIEAVPTIIFFQKGIAIDRIDGVDVAALTTKCKKLGQSANKEPLEDRLKSLINKSKVMIFMKGDRNAPRCGFSKQLMAIMGETGVDFQTFDILTDEEVRQGLKTYSDWPTYPQLYVKGELIGGLDIIKELVSSGDFEPTLKG